MNLYVDMDGTMAEYRIDATLEDYMTEGFYASLQPTELADYFSEMALRDDVNIYVLSIYILQPAYDEKMEWLDTWCPNIDHSHRILLQAGTDKAAAIEEITRHRLGKEDILVDDHTPNLESWQKAGGKAVKWLNGVNGLGGKFQGIRVGNIDELEQVIFQSREQEKSRDTVRRKR